MSIFKNTLEKLQHQQQILAILVFAFIAVFVWVGVSLFSSQTTTGISKELQKLAKPLIPNLDQEVLQKLQQKVSFSKAQLKDFPIYMIYTDKKKGEQKVEIHDLPTASPSPQAHLPLTASPSPSPQSKAESKQPPASPTSSSTTQNETLAK